MSEYASADHAQEVTRDLSARQEESAQRVRQERIGAACLKRTRAFGKLILFGEHFVVYKAPALVGAVAAYTDCDVEFTGAPGIEVVDLRPAVPGYKVEKAAEGEEAVKIVLSHLGVDTEKRGAKITFGGSLTAVSGIGASAAQVVSLARALSAALPRTLSEEEVNAAGYEGEKGYHGTPSGVDNTAATYGGVLRFQRTDGAPLFTMKKLAGPIRIVYASTGITASTTKVVGDVKAKKEADEAWFGSLLARYTALAAEGEAALDAGDMAALGRLLDENHALCQELTVSCKELDDLVVAARGAGAVGAKMSGTGRGGLMLALTPTAESQAAVAKALEKLAPQVWMTTFA
ncbi:mevalonate kinase [Emiliania huxleyi CCMP1516]|uniref:Mevalonate kinase n=2 Tax=Emiliania huxleyi TaxID=2903 RepID=A0A0D3JYU3_EMIH1|nr:mevalonate kinase [Emiliania huxleyi CCMP1516]EOD28678.1 mevalonate kinase [Emiliania huxleyi CCMP1516]|mmetsp:Transcript_50184/g.163944  ORF Transcript_50184/g.163944 Transcript_50184/m.163944 type:complete len:347 (-) Transcript_50184:230-1270(-)|eukprot:XP_005781107.1 mevalonate kinase [Emiliania huxleyi CCMP1516]